MTIELSVVFLNAMNKDFVTLNPARTANTDNEVAILVSPVVSTVLSAQIAIDLHLIGNNY